MLPVSPRSSAALPPAQPEDDDVDLDAILDAKLAELDIGDEVNSTPTAAMIPIPDQGPKMQVVDEMISQQRRECEAYRKDPESVRKMIRTALSFMNHSMFSGEEDFDEGDVLNLKANLFPNMSEQELDQMNATFMRNPDEAKEIAAKLEAEGKLNVDNIVQCLSTNVKHVSDDLVRCRVELLQKLGVEKQHQVPIARHPDFDVEIIAARLEFLARCPDQIEIICKWSSRNMRVGETLVERLDPRLFIASEWFMYELCLPHEVLEQAKRIGVETLMKRCLGSGQ